MIDSSNESDDDMFEKQGSGIHKFSEDDFKTVVYHQEWNEESELFSLPADYIRRDDMKIKDMGKNHIVSFLL